MTEKTHIQKYKRKRSRLITLMEGSFRVKPLGDSVYELTALNRYGQVTHKYSGKWRLLSSKRGNDYLYYTFQEVLPQ